MPIFNSNWQLRSFEPNLPKEGSYFQSETNKIDTTIELFIFKLVFVSNFTLSSSEFSDQIRPRKIFMVKNRKSEHHHLIPHIQISLATKVQLSWQFWGFFWSKTEKVNTTYFLHNFAYSYYSNAKFQLRLAILIFWTKFAQKGIYSQ